MSTQLVRQDEAEKIERVLIGGDLGKLTAEERVSYYRMVCESVGINPLTKPFEYIMLNGKLTLYARKDATDQLRNINQVSVNIVARESVEGCYIVTSRAKLPSGREDESIGAVPIENLKGEARANAMMKCETKSKRRVTLSICGLGMLDELEVEAIPSAKPEVQRITQDIELKPKSAAADRPQDDSQKGVVHAADPIEIVKEVLIEAKAGVEYIDAGKCANFHRECRKAIPERIKEKQGDLEYTWLLDNGYVNSEGEPTAEMIPASQWPQARNMCVAWLRAQS